MGERKRRRDRFFEEHRYCCFCGGAALATTVDHVPNRASFPGRSAPEGFEFPACNVCQSDSRLDEIAFSTMVHLLADDADQPSRVAFRNLMDGLKNNLPHLSFREMSANEKRRAVRELDLVRPPGAFAELPIIEIDSSWHDHIERYIAKLAKALFYKHLGFAAAAEWVTWTQWTYEKMQLNQVAIAKWIEMTPIVEVGQRSNVDLGDRFIYRVNYSAELGAFAAVGKFGGGLIFYAVILEPELASRLDLKVRARLAGERIGALDQGPAGTGEVL